ncbi:prepilin-type N-terminal cleavage/methylation domain-containing protein [Asaia bogorensis]|uniref:prepilin-type N-terminal cleavage/methylation domain-containing protein n=1 Tax=Asaia bogorensis TaxID=91915 RepID=UPI0028600AFB|nr:prepilin-type N-terminal cleavage/methylation domain-containing protein [Asaia bogorensis]MDR6183003.1 general secretion pathway protein J [Asaia bogorensis NBRC 16594]
MTPRRDEVAGFTLLELLIALVVFSLVLLVLRQGFDAATRFFEQQRQTLAAQDDLDAVDRFVRQVVTSADAGNGREGPLLVGTNHRLTWRGPVPHALQTQAEVISGGGRANMALFVDDTHRLVLQWSAYRHVIEPPTPVEQRVLLSGLEGVEWHYYASGHWSPTWYGNTLPELVRLRLVFAPGDARHWPDIVVAPRLNPLP